jgi:hypothetical protein
MNFSGRLHVSAACSSFFIGVLTEDRQDLTDGKSLFILDTEFRSWGSFSQITAMADDVLGKRPPMGLMTRYFYLDAKTASAVRSQVLVDGTYLQMGG